MKHWNLIPHGTDVLITHGPPKGHGDLTANHWGNESVGCEDLLYRINDVKPKISIFGHIHNGYGITTNGVTSFHNVSICDEEYSPVNEPHVIEL